MDPSHNEAENDPSYDLWYGALTNVLSESVSALQEAEVGSAAVDTSQFHRGFGSIMLLLALYGFDIMQLQLTENERSSFLATLGDYKEKVRLRLFQTQSPGVSPPSNWEPDALLESAGPILGGIGQNESHYFLSGTNQLIWMRLMAFTVLSFKRHFESEFKQRRVAVCSFLLHASHYSWIKDLEDQSSIANIAPSIAYYDHIRGFIGSPNFALSEASPQSYPSPVVENASRTPQALLYQLESYQRFIKDGLNKDNVESCLEPLKSALVFICRHQTPSQTTNSNSREQIESQRARETADRRFGSVEISESMRALFLSMLSACKNAYTPTRKVHLFIGWEELFSLFKFAAAWKVLPRPQSLQKMRNPYEVFGKLLVEWASDLKPSHCFDTAKRLYNLMQQMTQVAANPSECALRLACDCLPEFSFLLPPLMPQLSSHASIFLISPELAQHSAVLKQTILDYFPSKIASDRSLHECYAAFNQTSRRSTPSNPNAMDVDAVPSVSSSALSSSSVHNIDPTPFATPHEFAQWAKLRAKAQRAKFSNAALALGHLYDQHPPALASAIDSAVTYTTDSVPNLIAIMRSAFSWIRVADIESPYAERNGTIVSSVPRHRT